MLVANQLVEIKLCPNNIEHYRQLGHDGKLGDVIMVPPEQLTNGSHVIVDVVCDICGKHILKSFKDYLIHHTYDIDLCTECSHFKRERTCQNKYSVSNVFQTDWVKQKTKTTLLELYGVENISQSPEIRQKIEMTCQEKYGEKQASKSDEVKKRMMQTNLKKYGYEYYTFTDEFKEKTKQTNLKRYGFNNPNQNPQIKAKAVETMTKNGNIRTSQQQITLYETVKQKYPDAELNYPYSMCSLDIYINVNSIKIDIEYDADFWHQNQQRDIRRDKFLQSEGFKTLRIKSGHLLPTEEKLFSAIDYLVNTEYHYKEIKLSDWKEPKKEVVDNGEQNNS